ncbi:MAG: hypothetical protein H6917_18650 [Novosphingobium sp.]|nr:hypothetical protein [Novosphingobium sp.]MCP5404398.1 hypothetical protein [Novosphingobium sp.]
MSRIVVGQSCMLFSALALAGSSVPFEALARDKEPEPILASPEQDAAEELALELVEHPDVKAIKAGLREHLRATEIGRTKDGAATIDRAVDCLTNSLIFKELSTYRPAPYLLWGTEDTPREWRGRKMGCIGTAGDNPDNIYRTAVVQGGVRYEVLGQFDPDHRATQLIFQAGPGEPGFAPNLATAGSEAVEVLGAFSDRELEIAPDGSFRVTVGGETGGTNHVVTPPGPVSFGFRDTMADWNQEPVRLKLRALDPVEPTPFDPEELRRRVVGRMGDYVRGWSEYAKYGFGGLAPNTHNPPTGRAGGWGFVMGIRFSLAEDEALAVTVSRGDAKYLGFQVVDPWTIAGDARKNITSLNLAQATPDRGGTYTYVISPKDPGVANWLDTAGLHDGFGIVRWQATRAGATNDGLLRSFRIIKVAEAAKLPGIAKITPKGRQAQLEKRAGEWANRLR